MKRALSLFLACLVCLTPVSTLAAETGFTEFPGVCEETELAARVPFSTVKARCAGGTEYLDKFGVTRKELVSELSAHEHDNYYLGTVCRGGDFQSPIGDISYNGTAGMNCAGFVAYVLRKCGLDTQNAIKTMRQGGGASYWGSGLPYDPLSGASNYLNLVQYGHLVANVYESKAAMLAGGKCEKGDIILRFWTDNFDEYDHDNHIMIFWGSQPREDKVWHSASGRNHIGKMAEETATYILIKFAPDTPPAPPEPIVGSFADVKKSAWYAEAVQYVSGQGLMNGVSKTAFLPGGITTRGQMVTILYRLIGKPAAGGSGCFSDVPEGCWYTDAVNWAAEKGIVNGYADGTFHPEEKIKRQDMAAILYRYSRYLWLDTSQTSEFSDYSDAGEIADYAVEAMKWANGAGLITGTGDGRLSPAENATRAQTAAVLMRFSELYC